MRYIATIAGLTIGNFIWAAIKSKDWSKAAELSFFQAIAVGCCAIP